MGHRIAGKACAISYLEETSFQNMKIRADVKWQMNTRSI
jgi:hypothetical protein